MFEKILTDSKGKRLCFIVFSDGSIEVEVMETDQELFEFNSDHPELHRIRNFVESLGSGDEK